MEYVELAKPNFQYEKRQKELADLQSTLKSFSEKFERDAPTMTESQRAAKRRAKLGARDSNGVSGARRFEAESGVRQVEWISPEDQVAVLVFEDRDVVVVAVGGGPRACRCDT